MRRLISGIGRGVVAMSWRGRRPRRRPNCSQHVEGGIDVTPFRKLIAPRRGELRPAQLFRILRGKSEAHCAIWPLRPPPRCDPFRTLAARRDTQETRGTFDHDLAHVVLGFTDERDLQRSALGIRADPVRHRPHPFGAQPCLAGAATAQHQPGRPVPAAIRAHWRFLMRMREGDEVSIEARQAAENLRVFQHLRRQWFGTNASMRRASSLQNSSMSAGKSSSWDPVLGTALLRRCSFCKVSVRLERVRTVRSASCVPCGSRLS